jgi:TRAP transporter 4TM/12TM fusion protein
MVSHILFWGGLLLALVQLILPIFFELIDIQLRAIHVTLGVSLALLNFPFKKPKEEQKSSEKTNWIDVLMILIVLAANLNALVKALDIYANPGGASTLDLILGGALTIVILDSARRSVGWAIPVMVVLLLGYIFTGSYFPGMWRLRGIDLNYVINSIYYSPLGIYGSVTGMSATFIAMFIIFGSLLSATGGGKTFIDLAFALTGRYSGGPAKAAVISSALFGSISGSSVANVMVTGSYTIPMMKKLGYKPEFAGAVEAIASSGGGVTPPIMSITAFMMAEFLNISYLRIIGYALLPCFLYYLGVFFGVHFQTKRYGLGSVPKEEIPKWKDILTFNRLAGLLIPTVILLVMIGLGQPLIKAGFYAAVSALAVFLVQGIVSRSLKESFHLVVKALSEGGLDVARIVPILVSVGILVNLIGITGLAPKISGLILEVGGKNFLISLLIATIVPFLLGTSLPCSTHLRTVHFHSGSSPVETGCGRSSCPPVFHLLGHPRRGNPTHLYRGSSCCWNSQGKLDQNGVQCGKTRSCGVHFTLLLYVESLPRGTNRCGKYLDPWYYRCHGGSGNRLRPIWHA